MKRIEIILNGRKILDIQSDETDYGPEYIALEVSQETKNNITQALRLLQKVQSWNLEKEENQDS
ncbi:hypothetical protein DW167_09845 [Bacteroides thetaiotaomicron]|jgi:hypothetical protein|nr:hypothetical protein DW167_09845 [Bacteroides thetaiotaomicron]